MKADSNNKTTLAYPQEINTILRTMEASNSDQTWIIMVQSEGNVILVQVFYHLPSVAIKFSFHKRFPLNVVNPLAR